MKHSVYTWAVVVVLLCAGVVLGRYGRSVWRFALERVNGAKRVERTMDTRDLRARMADSGVAYPPGRIALVALKRERELELWAEKDGGWVCVRTYAILAASGHAGPKLREGDRQVPEGVYRVAWLNPNSKYHLSIKLDYPNEYDWARAQAEGRTGLGGDIFIHGGAASIGCIAVGDEAVEELFALVEAVGAANVKVIVAPNDLREGAAAATHPSNPAWTGELHEMLRREMREFRAR